MERYWLIGCWVLTGMLMGWGLYVKGKKTRKIDGETTDKKEGKVCIPKGNTGWPLIGETLDFIACNYTDRPVSFMEKRRLMYGEVFRSHLLGTPCVVSTDVEVNKVILQNQGGTFVPFYPKSIRELFGESSILRINGPLHRRVHGIIGNLLKSPHFKARITPYIETTTRRSLAAWPSGAHPRRLVYVHDRVKEITFGVLARVLLGVEAGEEVELLKREFAEFIKGLICLPVKLPGTTLYRSLKAKERLLKMVRRIVEERKAGMERRGQEGCAAAVDAVEALLREGLGVEFISGNLVEMMIPGEETLPTAITVALKYLSDAPLALHHLREENMELKRRKEVSGEAYGWADYMALPFTQNVISETLRMANIINAIWRKATRDVHIKGYLIPQGWCVLASLSAVHMDPRIYDDPLRFDPWRWQARQKLTVNTFIPFGNGQRLCPGLELSRLEICIFLHHFVTTYEWVAEEDRIDYFPTVKMKRKLPIILNPLPL